jgi:hypothetical protein
MQTSHIGGAKFRGREASEVLEDDFFVGVAVSPHPQLFTVKPDWLVNYRVADCYGKDYYYQPPMNRNRSLIEKFADGTEYAHPPFAMKPDEISKLALRVNLFGHQRDRNQLLFQAYIGTAVITDG